MLVTNKGKVVSFDHETYMDEIEYIDAGQRCWADGYTVRMEQYAVARRGSGALMLMRTLSRDAAGYLSSGTWKIYAEGSEVELRQKLTDLLDCNAYVVWRPPGFWLDQPRWWHHVE